MKANDCVCPKCGNDNIVVFNYPYCYLTRSLWLMCNNCGFNVILKDKDEVNPFKEEE